MCFFFGWGRGGEGGVVLCVVGLSSSDVLPALFLFLFVGVVYLVDLDHGQVVDVSLLQFAMLV